MYNKQIKLYNLSSSADVNHWFLVDQLIAYFMRSHLPLVQVPRHNVLVDLHGDDVRVINLDDIGPMLRHRKPTLLGVILDDASFR